MFPHFSLPFLSIKLHTNGVMVILFALFSMIMIWQVYKAEVKKTRLFLFIVGLSLFSFLGARLFHVIFERYDHFLKFPEKIFTQYDGMTLYGALLAGIVFTYFNRSIFSKAKISIWDFSGPMSALGLAFLKLGCFANGCCWGKLYGGIFHVRYFEKESVMPIKGIPVHPVQLYDSIIGLIIFLLLYKFSLKKEWKGRVFPLFLIFYSIGRYVTEFFRADKIRGENVFLDMSTSQLISAVLLLVTTLYMLREKRDYDAKNMAMASS